MTLLNKVPEWLLPSQPDSFPPTRTEYNTQLELEQVEFEIFLVPFLSGISTGRSINATLEDNHHPINKGRFMSWLFLDSERKAAYRHAQEIGAEVIADEVTDIADAVNSMEDVDRSNVRINARKWKAGINNRKRFGDVKQVDINTNVVDMRAILDEREKRVQAIDVESRTVALIDTTTPTGDDYAE